MRDEVRRFGQRKTLTRTERSDVFKEEESYKVLIFVRVRLISVLDGFLRAGL
jgi:hypothetical protein